jgi:BolA protein
MGAGPLGTLHSSVKTLPFSRTRQTKLHSNPKHHYIGAMNASFTGPVGMEITARLTSALAPTHLQVIDDSEQHRGHAGHDARGESHFTVIIESPSFAGRSRLERQRAVNDALGELLKERVHALSIRARAPGEQT